MPKIIDNAKEKILKEAKRETYTVGYAAMTIRSVAKAVGISVGTFYNYFSSKEMLVASFLLNDWLLTIEEMKKIVSSELNAIYMVERIYGLLCEFSESNASVFKDSVAAKNASSAFKERHVQLRRQLAEILKVPCCKAAKENSEFLPVFLAESFISFSVEGRSFEDIKSVINKLFI